MIWSVECKCIQTLHWSWHEGYREINARHALTITVCDKLLNAKATRREEAQAVAASLRDLTQKCFYSKLKQNHNADCDLGIESN